MLLLFQLLVQRFAITKWCWISKWSSHLGLKSIHLHNETSQTNWWRHCLCPSFIYSVCTTRYMYYLNIKTLSWNPLTELRKGLFIKWSFSPESVSEIWVWIKQAVLFFNSGKASLVYFLWSRLLCHFNVFYGRGAHAGICFSFQLNRRKRGNSRCYPSLE